MNKVFGSSDFRIIVSGFVRSPQLAHSQLRLVIAGRDWDLGGEVEESYGVVVPGLIAFARDASIRHWAPFAATRSYGEVLDLVRANGFSPGTPSEALHRWDVSSAFARYALSALFDANLGVAFAVAVRGATSETIVVRRDDVSIEVHEVPEQLFDRTIGELEGWAESLLASETDD